MPRPNARQRGYTSRWDKARATFLARPQNRWCRMCAQVGRQTPSTTVDHVIPHRGDQKLFWDTSNWAPSCTPCHNGPKQSQERTGVVRGCDVAGRPFGRAW